ncbi:glycosyltransferase family 4 protein [Acinetobacter sp. KS-LM10]|uniref:glycosyltransferase family 4 protein n=1 Tax=Acinetobacter sp. KS-LM10 TaxID=3120518 RepID=UPI0030D0F0A4
MERICFLIGNINNSGGTERVTTLIANALVKQGFQVSILSLAEGNQPFFDLEPSVCINCIYPEKISMKKNFLGAVWRIRKFVTANRVDTLIVVDSISCVFTVPALIGLNVKHICWEHFNFNINLGVKFRDLGRKWAAKYCDYIVTLTNRDMELWQQGLDKINAKIISIANPTPYENTNHRANSSSKTVLAMGRLTYQKGFDLLIEAWAEVCKVNLYWTLKIVGGGEDESKLKQQVINLGLSKRVNFIPITRNVTVQYQNASIYCLSSRFEGFGMVILEAQSFGIPVVSFSCDAGPSDLITPGENGFLAEAENMKDLSDQLLHMITLNDNDFMKMSQASYENAKKYSTQNITKEWLSILK